MPNRLAAATSPYLLQHADNPVDWHEWGEEAFAAAHAADRPILLSVGYAACHWCHVMAHESFEDAATAEFMNEHFVNVKVDREERPDVDRIYMDATQAMTGHGGWPMTVFLTPDGRPFFAGTYFPKDDRPGMPSFRRVIEALSAAWREDRAAIADQADRLTATVARRFAPASAPPDRSALAPAYQALRTAFDPERGGFGGAPKFPQAPTLEFLLRMAGDPAAPEAAAMLGATLDAMARGGIHDHLGGGFARYSVDSRWLVPHFEKMLYDNALLARVYLRGGQVLAEPRYTEVARTTLAYLLRDLLLPEGGFASAEDADSEGEEGTYYVFTHDEFAAAVGPEAAPLAADYFGVTPAGNFEGANILSLAASPAEVAARHGCDVAAVETAVASSVSALRRLRATRVRPARDDKVVTAWNGLALRALAEAGAVLDDAAYLQAARDTARFVLTHLRTDAGRLLRSWRAGRAAPIPAFSDDYGAMAMGLFTLFQATGELEWYRAGRSLVDDLVRLFSDPHGPGLFAAGDDAEELIARPKELMDNPAPSGNSLAAEALLTLHHYTGEPEYRDLVDDIFRAAGALLERFPSAVGHLLAVVASATAPPKEVAVVGSLDDPKTAALLAQVWGRFRPECVLAPSLPDVDPPPDLPLLQGRLPHDGPPVAYVCSGFVCDAPTGDPGALAAQLDA